ncbi:MAG: hypothetical protein ACLRS8_10040 [Parabacteroides merdae]
MSIASTTALLRCVSISAISPVPVPTSNMRLHDSVPAHAPSRTPSVPTFIAHFVMTDGKLFELEKGFDIAIDN